MPPTNAIKLYTKKKKVGLLVKTEKFHLESGKVFSYHQNIKFFITFLMESRSSTVLRCLIMQLTEKTGVLIFY